MRLRREWQKWGVGCDPRAQIAHFPLAAPSVASLALKPRRAAVLHVACEKIAAGDATLLVGQGEWRDGAVRPGLRILPAQACVLATFGEDLIHSRARNGKVLLGGGCGNRHRTGLVSTAVVYVVKLVG